MFRAVEERIGQVLCLIARVMNLSISGWALQSASPTMHPSSRFRHHGQQDLTMLAAILLC